MIIQALQQTFWQQTSINTVNIVPFHITWQQWGFLNMLYKWRWICGQRVCIATFFIHIICLSLKQPQSAQMHLISPQNNEWSLSSINNSDNINENEISPPVAIALLEELQSFTRMAAISSEQPHPLFLALSILSSHFLVFKVLNLWVAGSSHWAPSTLQPPMTAAALEWQTG